MYRSIIAAISGACCASLTVQAGGMDLTYENFRKTRSGAVEVVLKFTNNTGRDVATAVADCALLDANNKAVTVIPVAVQNIAAGASAYGNNFGPNDAAVEHADCRIKYAN